MSKLSVGIFFAVVIAIASCADPADKKTNQIDDKVELEGAASHVGYGGGLGHGYAGAGYPGYAAAGWSGNGVGLGLGGLGGLGSDGWSYAGGYPYSGGYPGYSAGYGDWRATSYAAPTVGWRPSSYRSTAWRPSYSSYPRYSSYGSYGSRYASYPYGKRTSGWW